MLFTVREHVSVCVLLCVRVCVCVCVYVCVFVVLLLNNPFKRVLLLS